MDHFGSADQPIGARIAHVRKLRGLTQNELAQRVPCSKSLIAQVERGHKPATPSLVAAVARVVNADVTELTGQPYRGRTAQTDGDADEAIRRASKVALTSTVPAERASHHYIDLSRAWLWAGKRDQALNCVLTAEKIAPQRTRYHPMARETIGRLLDVQRRIPEGLRGVAARMGLGRSGSITRS